MGPRLFNNHNKTTGDMCPAKIRFAHKGAKHVEFTTTEPGFECGCSLISLFLLIECDKKKTTKKVKFNCENRAPIL